MIFTVAVTVLALAASVVLTATGQGVPAAVLHLAFAVGIVPLIFAAMSHFVPVLTRSGSPARAIARLPQGAQAAGVLAVLAMQGILPRWALHAAAGADLFFAAVLLAWIVHRARRCLGAPHAGWRWYAAALACLMAALLAVPPLLAIPDFYYPLRSLHLHLNTLGLVGLAALGTLPVLLPTALARPDPDAAGWLRSNLWPTLGAATLVALGAGFWWPLSLAGSALLAWVIVSLARQWLVRFGRGALLRDGAAVSLAAALAGLLLLTLAGMAHGAGLIAARPSIEAWAAGFLLPLVTGALSQLLPVWRWPGPVIPARALMREKLAGGGAWRACFFLAAAAARLAELDAAAGLFAAAGMGLFLFAVIRGVRVTPAAR